LLCGGKRNIASIAVADEYSGTTAKKLNHVGNVSRHRKGPRMCSLAAVPAAIEAQCSVRGRRQPT
jgi:hypothetical protein